MSYIVEMQSFGALSPLSPYYNATCDICGGKVDTGQTLCDFCKKHEDIDSKKAINELMTGE